MILPKAATEKFDDLFAYTEAINALNHRSANALLVIQNDKIVAEQYSGFHSHEPGARPVQANSMFNVASARKSYIGFVVAYLLTEEKIKSIDDLVTTYLPHYDRDTLASTTIRHLLTHTHGLNEDEHGNVVREFIPGCNWAYRGINILMLTEIVQRVSGKSVAQLTQELVFTPLGFEETRWCTEPDDRLVQVIKDPADPPFSYLGTNEDGNQSNLFVSAREFAYWGYLHLKKGMEIVSPQVFETATTVQSPATLVPELPRQGFLWFVQDQAAKWTEIGATVPKGSYQILGVRGPLVLVIPEHDLVVVRMYNKHYNYGGDRYLDYLREFGDRVMACLHA